MGLDGEAVLNSRSADLHNGKGRITPRPLLFFYSQARA
jgi:hypothetical protein